MWATRGGAGGECKQGVGDAWVIFHSFFPSTWYTVGAKYLLSATNVCRTCLELL